MNSPAAPKWWPTVVLNMGYASDERRLASTLFLHFAKTRVTRPCKTPLEAPEPAAPF